MKIYVLLACFCLACLPAQAQNKKAIDSLMRVYTTAMHDTSRIMALTSIAYEYRNSNPDTCIAIAQKALEMSEKINFKKGIGKAWHNIGVGNFVKGKYPLALEYYQKSLKIREEIGDTRGISASLITIGVIYENQGNYALALEYYQKSLKIAEKLGDKQGISNSLNNVGSIYYNQGNFALALEYYQKSLKIREEIGDKQGISASLNNVGIIYHEQGNYPLALEYYPKSLKIKEELGDKRGISDILNNTGLIYSEQGNYPLALEYHQKSLKIREEIGDKQGITYSLKELANVARQQQDYDKSIEYAQRSLQIAQEIRTPLEMLTASRILFETYKLKGDYAKALEYHELFKQMNDSLFNVDKSKAIANLEAKAEVERKQKEIELLNKDKELDKQAKEALAKDLELQQAELARASAEQQAQAQSILLLNNEKTVRELTLQQQEAALTEGHLRDEQNKQALSLAAAKEETQRIDIARKNTIQLSLAGMLAAVAAAAIWLARLYRQKTRANTEILRQQRVLEDQANEIELTNTALQQAHEESETLLLNILPAPIAHRLKSGERAIADKFDSVTVLFADIVGFTKLSARTTPEELVRGLNAIFERFDDLAKKYNLEKIKTIGDAYMVAGGLPERSHDHAERVSRFALEMRAIMQEEALHTSGGEIVHLRIGIHTGEAVAGVIGTSKFAYDLWGDTVNTASRMESHGEAGKIHCSEEVYEALKEKFPFEERGEIEVKGKGMMRTWFLVGSNL